MNIEKPWRRIRAAAKLDDVRLHDLRHSFASVAASGGQSLVVIGKMLGHSQPATTARYAHLADDPVKAASEPWAGTLRQRWRAVRSRRKVKADDGALNCTIGPAPIAVQLIAHGTCEQEPYLA